MACISEMNPYFNLAPRVPHLSALCRSRGGGKMRKSGNEVARKHELSVNWQTIIFIYSPMCRHMFVLLPTTVRRQICFGFAPIQFIMPFKLVIQKSETFAKLNLSLSHQSFSLLTQDKKIKRKFSGSRNKVLLCTVEVVQYCYLLSVAF